MDVAEKRANGLRETKEVWEVSVLLIGKLYTYLKPSDIACQEILKAEAQLCSKTPTVEEMKEVAVKYIAHLQDLLNNVEDTVGLKQTVCTCETAPECSECSKCKLSLIDALLNNQSGERERDDIGSVWEEQWNKHSKGDERRTQEELEDKVFLSRKFRICLQP